MVQFQLLNDVYCASCWIHLTSDLKKIYAKLRSSRTNVTILFFLSLTLASCICHRNLMNAYKF